MKTKRLLFGLTLGMFVILFLNVELIAQTVLTQPDSLYWKVPRTE